MHCTGCGFENPAEANFCEECGGQLVRVGPSCKHELRPTAKFCGNCGAPLTGKETENRGNGESEKGSVESSVQRLEPEGQGRASTAQILDPRLRDARQDVDERRQLTVMFCDLMGSTALS